MQEETDENFEPALTCSVLPLHARHRRTGLTDVIYALPHPAASVSTGKDPSALLAGAKARTQATEQQATVPRLFYVPAARSRAFPADGVIDSPHGEPATTHPQELVLSRGTAFLSHRWIKEDSRVANPYGRMRGRLGLSRAVIGEGYEQKKQAIRESICGWRD